jgi:hypothetical protein
MGLTLSASVRSASEGGLEGGEFEGLLLLRVYRPRWILPRGFLPAWRGRSKVGFERSFLAAGRLIRAWMRVEMVSLGSERVSLRIGRVTFKIPCFDDLIAGSVASVAGSPCPARSKGRISSNALCRGYCATIYRTHLLKACPFEHPAKHMPQRSSKSDESKRNASH